MHELSLDNYTNDSAIYYRFYISHFLWKKVIFKIERGGRFRRLDISYKNFQKLFQLIRFLRTF